MKDKLKVGAFNFMGQGGFYGAMSGCRLSNDYKGYCQVLFKGAAPMIFYTGINEYGERSWFAEGNNPKKDIIFV